MTSKKKYIIVGSVAVLTIVLIGVFALDTQQNGKDKENISEKTTATKEDKTEDISDSEQGEDFASFTDIQNATSETGSSEGTSQNSNKNKEQSTDSKGIESTEDSADGEMTESKDTTSQYGVIQ